MSRIDDAKVLLDKLHDRLPDVTNMAICRTNGLIIYALQKSGTEDSKLDRLMGAMASALYSVSKRAGEELLKGQFQSANIEIGTGNIFLIFTGKVILVLVTKKEPNLGLISLELEDAAKKLNDIFE